MNIFTLLITQPLTNGIILFYHLLGNNLGLAIIAFSLALRFILMPLTKPYMESMKKMKEFQKDLEKLKKKHAKDKTKLAQAQNDFYKEKGINPTAGCLPYLLQIVVLITLFRVFTSTLAPNIDTAAKFNELLYPQLRFTQGQTVNTGFLGLELTKPDTINVPGIPFAIPGVILVLASIFQFVSAKMAMPYLEEEEKLAKKTPGKGDDFASSMQSSMIYMFPVMTLFIGVNFPSGLAIYWLVFSFFQAFQQYRSAGWGGMTPIVRKWRLAPKPRKS